MRQLRPRLGAWALGMGLTTAALAQPLTPLVSTSSSIGDSPTTSTSYNASQSIVLARPLHDSVPSFINDLDTYFMPDELVNQIESQYYMKLREFSMKQGFLQHSRDSRLQRNYIGTPAEEQAVRTEMARSMKQYMLVRGLPRYLSSHKETRFLGESYTQAVSFAQNVGRIEIKSKDESWKFGSGINPFSTKAWAKYSNKRSTLELYNVFNQQNSLGLVLLTNQGRYSPRAQYFILRNAFETGVTLRHSALHESGLATYIPFAAGNVLHHAVTYLSTSYRF